MAKDIMKWDPEDQSFWESEGKKIAWQTLWISIPCLLCGFAVWIYWSVITVQMINLGFSFSKGDLFTLNAIAGLSGATLRIPASFFILLLLHLRIVGRTVPASVVPLDQDALAPHHIAMGGLHFNLLSSRRCLRLMSALISLMCFRASSRGMFISFAISSSDFFAAR